MDIELFQAVVPDNPPMPAPTTPSGDAIQATINVSIAQSHRLVSSWLPPPTPEEITSQKTEEQLAKEDAELFRPTPPRLGLGAPIPKDFLESADPKTRRQGISANERLKRKIMGRTRSSGSQEASKPRPRIESNPNGDGDDDEGGRSSLGKPKRRKVALEKKGAEHSDVVNEEESDFGTKEDVGCDEKPHIPPSAHEKATKTSTKRPVRFGIYLDVHRAEKAKKKKKKKLTN